MKKNFFSMPLILKFLTIHALACSLFLIGSIIPHDSFVIEGDKVTYLEWWGSGSGFAASLVGLVFPIAGILLLKKHSRAREYYLIALLFALLGPAIFMGSNQFNIDYYLFGLFSILVIAAYLYMKKSVKNYFISKISSSQNT